MRELLILVMCTLIFLVVLWPYGHILARLGYSRWFAVLMIVPLVNIIMLWVFAYADWPAFKAAKSS